jgi:hypothetical protein
MNRKCLSEKKFYFCRFNTGFSLSETAAALIIIALICSSVVSVFNNSAKSAADSVLRIDAFEVAQQNLEKLLASSYVKEGIEYGVSDKYPAIEWQTAVETFYEPITKRLWARAVSTAYYFDIEGNAKNVELASWITDLTQSQVLELIKRNQLQKELLAEAGRLIETIEDAADNSVVDVNTIQQWVDNGMPITEDGFFIKDYLDLYKKYNGNPPGEQKAELDNKFNPILLAENQTEQTQPAKPGEQPKQPDKPKPEFRPCGKTMDELNKMTADEFFKWWPTCPDVFIK